MQQKPRPSFCRTYCSFFGVFDGLREGGDAFGKVQENELSLPQRRYSYDAASIKILGATYPS